MLTDQIRGNSLYVLIKWGKLTYKVQFRIAMTHRLVICHCLAIFINNVQSNDFSLWLCNVIVFCLI